MILTFGQPHHGVLDRVLFMQMLYRLLLQPGQKRRVLKLGLKQFVHHPLRDRLPAGPSVLFTRVEIGVLPLFVLLHDVQGQMAGICHSGVDGLFGVDLEQRIVGVYTGGL